MMGADDDAGGGASEVLAGARRRGGVSRLIVERGIKAAVFACGGFSLAITAAIVGVLGYEAIRFFGLDEVSVGEFLTGTSWNPLLGAEKRFGMWPLVTATIMVAAIAALVAIPLGLVTAVYLSEYAPERVRRVLKPVLEVLAGIPTVVNGFFALTVVTPVLQWASVVVQRPFVEGRGRPWYELLAPVGDGDPAALFEFFNTTSAGIAVGIMCLPMVSSLSEDALRSVPRDLREGAAALGGTRFDVSVKVVVPAALSGVIASFLLAIARAVGETMIVAVAAGGLAQMAFGPTGDGPVFRPHEGSQTMTAYMVQIFLGDAPFGSAEYYSAYAIGGLLFCMTLVLTIAGNAVLKRFREAYE